MVGKGVNRQICNYRVDSAIIEERYYSLIPDEVGNSPMYYTAKCSTLYRNDILPVLGSIINLSQVLVALILSYGSFFIECRYRFFLRLLVLGSPVEWDLLYSGCIPRPPLPFLIVSIFSIVIFSRCMFVNDRVEQVVPTVEREGRNWREYHQLLMILEDTQSMIRFHNPRLTACQEFYHLPNMTVG